MNYMYIILKRYLELNVQKKYLVLDISSYTMFCVNLVLSHLKYLLLGFLNTESSSYHKHTTTVFIKTWFLKLLSLL